ncbi:iron-containing redox enzyme family protein [Leptolyngbya sp. FACHB-541]|uniref:iron-containing redox enzyme family protein n=1 Tax=Leptolyngbya sp. FACHB-541 TaxID=2692810 RepID=UPI00168211B2|nr:iron-containing redox enzyme family protein [Leptolyngbya sp. FACHB-541]MBD1998847.1 iron-containing redox enzyme family protein [Leptolyngbya sp. FACHB-541]
MVSALKAPKIGYSRSNQLDIANYAQAEKYLDSLFKQNPNQVLSLSSQVEFFQNTVSEAILKAFASVLSGADRKTPGSHLAHRFLQRILYQINVQLSRLNADHSQFLTHECSTYLHSLRNQIEKVWQRWELAQFELDALKKVSVEKTLNERIAADSNSISAENDRFFRTQMTQAGYQRLLAIASIDGLAAVSHLCRTLNATSKDHSIPTEFTRLFLQENYLAPLNRQYSTYFNKMLAALGMDTEPETYFDVVPWEVFALHNQAFLLTREKNYLLQYVGGLLYLEVAVPAAFTHYQVAAQRLRLPSVVINYWDLHTRLHTEDGYQMLDKVVLPVANQCPQQAWELVLGYDQQRAMSRRAVAAIASSVRAAERAERAIAKSSRAKN